MYKHLYIVSAPTCGGEVFGPSRKHARFTVGDQRVKVM